MNTNLSSELGYQQDETQPETFDLYRYIIDKVISVAEKQFLRFYNQRIKFFSNNETDLILDEQINKLYDNLQVYMNDKYLFSIIDTCLSWTNFPNENPNIEKSNQELKEPSSFIEYLNRIIYDSLTHQNALLTFFDRPENFDVFKSNTVEGLSAYHFTGYEQITESIVNESGDIVGETRDFIQKIIILPTDVIQISILIRCLCQLLIIKKQQDGKSYTISSTLNTEQVIALYDKVIELKIIKKSKEAKSVFFFLLNGSFSHLNGEIHINNRKKDMLVFLLGFLYAHKHFTCPTPQCWNKIIDSKIFVDSNGKELDSKPFED